MTKTNRCIICGGVYDDDELNGLDACVCGYHDPEFTLIALTHLPRALFGIIHQLTIAIRHGDWWWFRMAFNMGEW